MAEGDTGNDAATGNNGGPQQTQNQQTAPWFASADDTIKGYITSRGLDKKDAAAAALDVIKAHQEANRLLGAPHDQLVRIPTRPDDEEGWKNVYSKLGVPDDPSKYDFSAIKFADGTALTDDKEFESFVRTQAAALKLSSNAAQQLAQSLVKKVDADIQAERAEATASLDQERKALADDWGSNMEANKFIAKQGALKIGLTAEDVDALEGVTGYKKLMNALLAVGKLAGEHKFVADTNRPGGNVFSKTEAIAKKAELMSDQAWKARYLGGDKAALNEIIALNTIITSKSAG